MSESTGGVTADKKRSLFTLIADIPRLLVELIKGELTSLKDEMVEKLKHAGIGIGLFVGAAFFAFFAFSVLIAAAVLGIAVALPAWLAALIVAAALLVIVAILVGLGVAQVKRGVPPAPTETIKSVKKDVYAIKGIGKRATK
jgi:hypothetical protein